MSGRTVIPDTDRRDFHDEDPLLIDPLPSTRNLFIPESQQFLSKLLPEQFSSSKKVKPVGSRVNTFTPGETLGDFCEAEEPIPMVRTKPVEFIPLELARSVVKRMEEDMKRATSVYKQQLKDMLFSCEHMETALLTQCGELLKRGQEAHKTSTLRFTEKTKQLQEELNSYKVGTEGLLEQLREKIRILNQEKKELMEKLLEAVKQAEETVAMIPPSQDPSDVVDLVLRTMVLQVDLKGSEPARTLYSLMTEHESLLQQSRTLQTTKTNAKLSLENWTQEFERAHNRPPKNSELRPVAHLELDLVAANNKIQLLQQQMTKLHADILTLGFTLPSEETLVQVTEQRDSLQQELNNLAQVYKTLEEKFDPRLKFELEQMTADRNGLRRELEQLRKELATPSTRDGPTETALKSQLEFLTNELAIFKGKSFVLEVENKELHEQLEALGAGRQQVPTSRETQGHDVVL